MQAEIVAAGTELLLGQIIDTNTPWISQRLASVGIDLYYQATVGDNRDRMEMVLRTALQRSTLIIITGGLGPTTDDLTREVVAKVMDLPLLLHPPSLKRMEERFSLLHRKMTENNKKQAYLPQGAIPIENNWGTAPGFILEKECCTIITLPGVPNEMKGMMQETVLPYLGTKTPEKERLFSRTLNIYGLGESSLETELQDLLHSQTNPTIALLAKKGHVLIRLTMKAQDEAVAQKSFTLLTNMITERVGDVLYSQDSTTMEEVVMGLLQQKKMTLSVAESITGGLVSARLTAVPGASGILQGAFIPYTRKAKKQLGLTQTDLQEGTVSPRITAALAHRVRQLTNSSIGAAVTGLAGPGRGEEERPLGSVYTCICTPSLEKAAEGRFLGQREEIRERATLLLLDEIRRFLITRAGGS